MLYYQEIPVVFETGEDAIVEMEILYDIPQPNNRESDWDYYGGAQVVNVWVYDLKGAPWKGLYDEGFVNKEVDKWLRECDITQVMNDNLAF